MVRNNLFVLDGVKRYNASLMIQLPSIVREKILRLLLLLNHEPSDINGQGLKTIKENFTFN